MLISSRFDEKHCACKVVCSVIYFYFVCVCVCMCALLRLELVYDAIRLTDDSMRLWRNAGSKRSIHCVSPTSTSMLTTIHGGVAPVRPRTRTRGLRSLHRYELPEHAHAASLEPEHPILFLTNYCYSTVSGICHYKSECLSVSTMQTT